MAITTTSSSYKCNYTININSITSSCYTTNRFIITICTTKVIINNNYASSDCIVISRIIN
jgi:hypothetical protein